MHNFDTYQARSTKFHELAEHNDWRIKVYTITAHAHGLTESLLTAAKNIAFLHLPKTAITDQRYGVGFLIIHQGLMANWILLDWWEHNDIIHHLVFSSPSDNPNNITAVTDHSIMACVYELEIIEFERRAWIDTILSNKNPPDFERYLQMRLNG